MGGGAWEQVPRRSVCVHIGSAGLNLCPVGLSVPVKVASVSGPPAQLSSGPCNVQARLTGACEDSGGPSPGGTGGHARHGWRQARTHRRCCWKPFCGNRASRRVSTSVCADGRAPGSCLPRVAHSTPARRPSGPVRTPASTARASGLPTPAGRRLSGLPLVTPSTVPRTLASPLCVSTRQLSSEPRRTSAGR